jgi:hypothetical protein
VDEEVIAGVCTYMSSAVGCALAWLRVDDESGVDLEVEGGAWEGVWGKGTRGAGPAARTILTAFFLSLKLPVLAAG